MNILVKALRTHTYAGKPRQAGREYRADKSSLRFLRTVGWAEEVVGAPVYQTRMMVAAEPINAVKPKRKYTKRKKAE